MFTRISTHSLHEDQQVKKMYFMEPDISLPCHWVLYCTMSPVHTQGRIKVFVGLRHLSSLGPFEDSKSIVETTVYWVRDAWIIEKHG
jgi:hypothetical protein